MFIFVFRNGNGCVIGNTEMRQTHVRHVTQSSEQAKGPPDLDRGIYSLEGSTSFGGTPSEEGKNHSDVASTAAEYAAVSKPDDKSEERVKTSECVAGEGVYNRLHLPLLTKPSEFMKGQPVCGGNYSTVSI
jgi:hypothetical protein